MLNKLLKSKNKPIAILLVESRMCDLDAFIKEYMKSIVCTGNDCVWCKKIDTDSYFDFIKIDGNKETIKKEQIQDVISRYSKSSTESRGIKFYVIYGIENSTTQAINSLLKFLEEPTNNTYAILTTRSDNFVLPTIKSRCQIYKLTKEYSWKEKLKEYKLSSNELSIIEKTYFSIDEAINDLNNNVFLTNVNFCNDFVKHKHDLSFIKELSDKFKKMEYQQIRQIINILLAINPTNESFKTLVESIKNNPVRVLLFNKIWESI